MPQDIARNQPSQAIQRITHIEGLRAYLAFWVVLDHILGASGYTYSLVTGVAQFICSGWYAVDVFIIISGFVIFYLLDHKPESYRCFITRRFFRLWPLFFLLFFISIFISKISLVNISSFAKAFPASPVAGNGVEVIESWWENLWVHIALHVPMLHGLVPNRLVDMSPDAFLGPAWSISLEWQFYLLAPFLFLWVRSGRGFPIAILSLGCLLCFLFSPRWEYDRFGAFSKVGAFLPMHAEFFYIGCLSYFGFKYFHKHPLPFRCLPVGVMIAVVGWFVSGQSWHWIPTGIWLIFFGLIVDLQKPQTSGFENVLGKIFDNRVTLHLGKISYSIYLAHIPVIAVAQALVFKWFPELSQKHHLLALAVFTIPMTVFSSHLLYNWVEKPGIRWGSKLAKKF